MTQREFIESLSKPLHPWWFDLLVAFAVAVPWLLALLGAFFLVRLLT